MVRKHYNGALANAIMTNKNLHIHMNRGLSLCVLFVSLLGQLVGHCAKLDSVLDGSLV